MSVKTPILCLIIVIYTLMPQYAKAQGYYRAERLSMPTDSAMIALNINAEGFFRNNEYDTRLAQDYSLPGYRLSADLGFMPSASLPVCLRLGASHIYYWGANLYPAGMAYLDLPYWMGDNGRYTPYRIKPYFQASIAFNNHLKLTLGNLDGGRAHELITPLYNPELNLTSDHETGFGILFLNDRMRMEGWLDWQSFIWKRDDHQEAFVAGLTFKHQLLKQKHRTLVADLQFLAHHRGGVNNTRIDTVHTWANMALGMYYRQAERGRNLHWGVAGYMLGYTQKGGHFPLDRGWGAYLLGDLELGRLETSVALWYGRGFISPLGEPFAQGVSMSTRLPRPSHGESSYLRLGIDYKLVESSCYSFGASARVWLHPYQQAKISHHIELYLSISPRIVIRRI